MDSIRSTDSPAKTESPKDWVQGTFIDLGDFRVRQNRRGDQTILEFEGSASPFLGHELERLASRCRGDVGLDLSEIEGLTPALLPTLERVRKRLGSLKHCLFLCNPPSKLLDALNLGGIASLYPVAQASGECGITAEGPQSRKESETDDGLQAAKEAARREIAHFDRSLKRTERLTQDLDSAARCVQKILPRKEPTLAGYSFAFIYRQSEIVGGDFFDFFLLGERCLGISIGDVSGKGLEAAILMCLAKKIISIRARDPAGSPESAAERTPVTPREVLCRVNEDIRSDLDRSSFITAIYAVLDGREGILRFARAGHEKPLLFTPGSGQEPRPLTSDGVALGLLGPDQFRFRLQEHFVEIRPGDGLLLFTDGAVDARNPRGQPFSRRRLQDALRRIRPGQPPGEALTALLEEIARHVGGASLYDDMTALLILRDSPGVAQR